MMICMNQSLVSVVSEAAKGAPSNLMVRGFQTKPDLLCVCFKYVWNSWGWFPGVYPFLNWGSPASEGVDGTKISD